MAEFVGIDVCKDRLDIYFRPSGEVLSVANDQSGIGSLVERCLQKQPTLVVLEATGGYEMAVAAALGVAKVPCAVVNPRQVRDFAKALGRLAKTDRIDAAVLAHFGEAIQPAPKPVPESDAIELEALVGRRRQLIDMLVSEKNRQARATTNVRPSIDAHIQWLQTQLDKLDRDLGDVIKRSPLWRERDELLQSIPGIGNVISRTLIADLPELGRLSRGAITSLAGLAPHNQDSGQHRGQRHIWGGRASVRTALYQGALVGTRYNPLLRSMYKRLLGGWQVEKIGARGLCPKAAAHRKRHCDHANALETLGDPGELNGVILHLRGDAPGEPVDATVAHRPGCGTREGWQVQWGARASCAKRPRAPSFAPRPEHRRRGLWTTRPVRFTALRVPGHVHR